MKELLLGCGNRTVKTLCQAGKNEFEDVTRLDIDPDCEPDITHDLNNFLLPFDSDEYDEIHAYEILEHVGSQGDWLFFFDQFDEFARVLKADGFMFMTFPKWNSVWAFGDPGHARVLVPEMFQFLDREWYEEAVGKTAATDYRHCFDSNWKIVKVLEVNEHCYGVILQNKK
jgi:cyclopropane fatty-acyl-phospholipid synthase-like methyltransferase